MSNKKKSIRGIDIHDGLRLVNPIPVDIWSGPYSSVEEANATILKGIRYRTMIVRIVNESGDAFLYWYKDGVEDEDLVQYLYEDFTNVSVELNKKVDKIDYYNHVENESNPHLVTKYQVGLGNVTDDRQATKVEFDEHVGDYDTHVDEFNIHVENRENPHGVTKDQVGLGNVDDVKQATKVEFNVHTDKFNSHVRDYVNHVNEFNGHINNKENPHSVTKGQVGLGNVDDESKATMFDNPTFTGEVKGVTKSMVGLGNVTDDEQATKVEFDTHVESFNIHTEDKTNPHSVTKAQVGLGKVDDVKQATKVEFDDFVALRENPHEVTKSQVGLGNVKNIEQATKVEFDDFVALRNNPHSVTKAQVGLGNVDDESKATMFDNPTFTGEVKGVTKSMVGLGNVTDNEQATKAEFNVHVEDTTNPHSVTKEHVKLGNVDNIKQATKEEFTNHIGSYNEHVSEFNTHVLNFNSHTGDKSNPHNVTKGQVDLANVEDKSSATIRSEITSENVTNALAFIPEDSANKGIASGYASLDSNKKVPLSQLPDTARQQTYVVETVVNRDSLTDLFIGEKCYVTDTGDSYIWDGLDWVILAKADWENVNLQWVNILSKPISSVTDIDDTVNKRHIHDNKIVLDGISETLVGKWNSASTHTSDEIRHISADERSKWNTVDNKANTSYVDGELNRKVNKIEGKGLSTEDYTTDEKDKLSGIEAEANKYVHPENHSIDMIIESVTNKVMTADERVKLSDISDNANKVESSTLNGNIKIDGEETIVYMHPTGTNPHGTTKSDVGLGNVDNTADKDKELSDIAKTALAGKVDNSRVLTDVPELAKFTDTLYTGGDNIKIDGTTISVTGELGLTEEQVKAVKVNNATNADTVNGKTVLSNVPLNAKFTDTNTITTINGKTGVISKADIVALGIPAQDTVVDISGKADKTYVDSKVKTDVPLNATLHKEVHISGTAPSTNKDVIWIDTSKELHTIGGMPVKNGVLINFSEGLTKLTNGVIDLGESNAFVLDIKENTTFSITNAVDDTAHYFTLLLRMETARILTFPGSIKWLNKEIPDMTETDTDYILTFVTVNGGVTWYGNGGGY